MRPRLSVSIQKATASSNLPTRAQVLRWLRAALEVPSAELAVRWVDADEGQTLNAQYRGKDYPTNVLTFTYDPPSPDQPLQGDLVLCVPVVVREAQEQHKDLHAHFAHLLVHGMLHLQGYDHETEADAERMETRETEILTQMGYDDPYRHYEGAPAAHGRIP